VQAVGQSLAGASLGWFTPQHLAPSQILTFCAALQTARLFGGELGAAFVQTGGPVREQIYSNLVGLHGSTRSRLYVQRRPHSAHAVAARSVGQSEANARATALLGRAVQQQAYVLAFIDAFMIVGFAVVAALLLMLLFRPAPADDPLAGSWD